MGPGVLMRISTGETKVFLSVLVTFWPSRCLTFRLVLANNFLATNCDGWQEGLNLFVVGFLVSYIFLYFLFPLSLLKSHTTSTFKHWPCPLSSIIKRKKTINTSRDFKVCLCYDVFTRSYTNLGLFGKLPRWHQHQTSRSPGSGNRTMLWCIRQ